MHMPVSDAKDTSEDLLLAQALKGDAAALEVLLHRSAVRAAAIAWSVTGNRDDALDAAQTALIKITLQIRAGVMKSSQYRACLYAAAHGAAVDVARQSSSRAHREALANAGSREERTMQQRAELVETLAALREEMASISPDTATALALHHLDGLPVSAVAELLGTSVDACKQRLLRGREELRSRLERRGITLAGTLLIAGAIEGLFQASLASAAEVPQAEFERVTAAALEKRLPSRTRVGQIAIMPPTLASAGERRWGRAGICVVVAFLAAVGSLLLYPTLSGTVLERSDFEAGAQSSDPDRQKTSPGNVDTARQAVAETGLEITQRDAEDDGAPATSRWQTPRLFNGTMVPLSVSASGPHAAVLSRYTDSPLFFVSGLQLITTHDKGETWQILERIPGYYDGGVLIKADGSCAVLAPTIEDNAVELVTVGLDGRVSSKARICQTGGRRNSAVDCKCALLPVEGGAWAVISIADGIEPAFIKNDGTFELTNPKYPKHWRVVRSPYTVWAFDAQHAGFVTETTDQKGMQSVITADGGKTWKAARIPVQAATDSNGVEFTTVPLRVSQYGARIVLLYRGIQSSAKGANKSSQAYVMTSDDGGAAWSEPSTAGRSEFYYPQWAVDQHHNPVFVDPICYQNEYFMHALDDGKVWVSQTNVVEGTKQAVENMDKFAAGKLEYFSLMQSDGWTYRTLLYQSHDSGKTWSDSLACTITEPGSPLVIGGDGETVHLAWMVKGPRNDDTFLGIRTLTRKAYAKSPALPVWFKVSEDAPALKGDF